MVVELVYAICDDGPVAGYVAELNVGDRVIKIITDADGVCVYRRYSWGPVGNHIAHFKWSHQEVV